jgi:hypothetical protein
MMKKSLIFLGLLALTLVVAGCSQFGDSGNPTELTGTWSASSTSYAGGNTATVAGAKEGTWTFDVTLNPGANSTVVSGTSTFITYAAPQTFAYSATRVIKADGSYTDTLTYKKTTTDRAAAGTPPANTYYSGATGQYTAGTLTTVTTKTVTVTPNADGTYQELVVLKRTTTTSGSETGTTYSDYSSTSTNQVQSGNCSFNNNAQFYAGNTSDQAFALNNFKQTVAPSYSGNSKDDTSASTDTIVIKDDGTYTWTTKVVTTRTTPSAGTATWTRVSEGTVTGANSNGKIVTFNQTKATDTYVGTGALISGNYPSTASTYTQATTGTNTFNYYFTSGKTSYLQLYSATSNYNKFTKAASK